MQTPTVNRLPTNPWPPVTVLGVLTIGVLIAGFENWRYGAVVMTMATLLAGVARMLLPRRVSDLLVVRRCWMDITILFNLGTMIGVLALVVPPGTRNAAVGDRLRGGHHRRKKGPRDKR